jgi:hypothetical protein
MIYSARDKGGSERQGRFFFSHVPFTHAATVMQSIAQTDRSMQPSLACRRARRRFSVSRTASSSPQQLEQLTMGATKTQSVSTEQLRSKTLGSNGRSSPPPAQAKTTLASALTRTSGCWMRDDP